MSYNITSWKVKKLENLQIPIKSLYKHERKNWHPKRINSDDGTVIFQCGCCQELKGHIENDILKVISIDMAGEGSGTFTNWILEPALKNSTGILEAVIVWEGGDSITKLIVNNGNIEQKEIEL